MATNPKRTVIDVSSGARSLLGRLPLIVVGLLLIVFIATGVYSVPADSEAVLQRFGKHIDTQMPGLRFKIPFGVDMVTIVPVQRQLKLEFGFQTYDNTNAFQPPEDPEAEKNMVTGDLSAAEVEWIVQYHIENSKTYLFHVRNPEVTLRDLSEAAVREVVGDRTVDAVLTTGRQDIETEVGARLREVVTTLDLGLRIDTVQLKNVNPPKPVQDSFDEVNRAQQEREQMINQANGDYNKVVPKAAGEAEQKISAAEGYALKRVNEAEGDGSRFTALLKEYDKAPEVTRRRIFLETVQEVIPGLDKTVIIDEDARNFLPMLQLPNGK